MTPEADLAGRTFAHYRLVERIGSGGMGVVYRAEDTHLDRIVAIKVLPADAVADPERRRRFVQEAKAASALNHPNIIHVYDIGSSDGIDFIAMEYVPGTTLEQVIGRQGLSRLVRGVPLPALEHHPPAELHALLIVAR
jgi:serine/threonine protein kinase